MGSEMCIRDRFNIHVYEGSGNPVLTAGVRSNGALTYSQTDDLLLVCLSAGGSLNIYNLDSNGATVAGPADIGFMPVDIFLMGFVQLGPVVGDVDGDSSFDVVLPGRFNLGIYNSDLTLKGNLLTYGDLRTWIQEAQIYSTLAEQSEQGEYYNKGSLPALGDMNHNGNPDIVFGLHSWVVCLTYVTVGPEAGSFQTVWTWYEPGAQFWSHPALADTTRDGFLDVLIGSGKTTGPVAGKHNLTALDGSPANNHRPGVQSSRRLWKKWWYDTPADRYRAIGQGPAVGNGVAGDRIEHLLLGTVWTDNTLSTLRSSWAYYDTNYEGHGFKEKYPPPEMWPHYLVDRFNSACYDFDPSW